MQRCCRPHHHESSSRSPQSQFSGETSQSHNLARRGTAGCALGPPEGPCAGRTQQMSQWCFLIAIHVEVAQDRCLALTGRPNVILPVGLHKHAELRAVHPCASL